MKKNVMFAGIVVVPVLIFGGLMVLSPSMAVASDPIEEREELMEGVGKAMKQLGAIFKGEAKFDGPTVKVAAATIAGNVEHFLTKFPKGSMSEKSEAKATIWEDPDGFKAAAANAMTAAKAVSKVGADGNEAGYKEAFMKLGGGCKGCHTKFREKKKK